MPIQGCELFSALGRACRPAGAWSYALALCMGLSATVIGTSVDAEPKPSIAMHGAPAYPDDFSHFNYADPAAPKGGRITYGVLSSFDSVNPFIVRGEAASGFRDGISGNNVYQSLMERSYDEAFSLYGLIAETIDVPEDRAWVEFQIRPIARFSDGEPIKPEDVMFTFDLLREHGLPFMRANYANVASVEKRGEHGVRFIFKDASNKELPLILGLMPILPKHKINPEEFEKSTLTPIVGSGPYIPDTVEQGNRIIFKRDPNYWGKDLPVNRGLYNFDEIRFDYYREQNAMIEAFKKGLIDVMPEGDPSHWSQGYDFPAVKDGRVVKETVRTGLPKAMYGLAMNTRRPAFKDPRVREALIRLYDFEWADKNLFFDLYQRTGSYFQGSELSALGKPIDQRERAILGPLADGLRKDVLDGTWAPPTTDGSGRDRAQLKAALDLLVASGYRLDSGVLKNAQSGAPLTIEILTRTRDQERVASGYQRTLKSVGVDAQIRSVDSAQYESRRKSFDFDMTFWTWASSLSPGNEQIHRWTSAAADEEGSFNLAGVRDPAVDVAIQALIGARTREDLIASARALDRALISGFYVVPLFHVPEQWLARWTRIEHPQNHSTWGYVTASWWAKPGVSP